MNYYVGSLPTASVHFPCILLTRSTWDDFSYKTTFYAYFYKRAEHARESIGKVKIASFGQEPGRTNLPTHFTSLDPTYFSLGQSESYYGILSEIGRLTRSNLLEDLRDLSLQEDLQNRAKDEQVFTFSVARSLGSLERLSRVSPSLETPKSLSFNFSCLLHNSNIPTKCDFTFEGAGLLPGRINVLVGKNGAGKTQFLANLVAAMTGEEISEEIQEARTKISFIIAVSYSIFDRFFLPDEIRIPSKGTRNSYVADELRYRYIGLREKSKDGDGIKILGPVGLSQSFGNALGSIRDKGEFDAWFEILEPLLGDALLDVEGATDKTVLQRFRRLGAGHKATLSILTRLFAEVKNGSMVVIDEPENHLHPTLLSMTIDVLRKILEKKEAYAIISTHSPIVVQEVPSKYVKVLKKINGIAIFSPLPRESFGTSLDTLTADIFGVSGNMHNFVSVLKDLVEDGVTLNKIDQGLGNKLSFEARSFFRSMGGEE